MIKRWIWTGAAMGALAVASVGAQAQTPFYLG